MRNKSKQRITNEESVAVKELMSYRILLRDIERLKSEINEAKEILVNLKAIRYDLPKVQGGIGQSPLENATCNYIDLENKLGQKKIERERKLEVINYKMSKLDNREQSVLRLYFIEGLTIDRISRSMNYSEKQVWRLKKSGIKKYEEL